MKVAGLEDSLETMKQQCKDAIEDTLSKYQLKRKRRLVLEAKMKPPGYGSFLFEGWKLQVFVCECPSCRLNGKGQLSL